jgi:protease-4
VGIKVSSQRYRGFSARSVPIVDVADAAQHRRTGFLSVEADPYGTLLLQLGRIRDDPSAAGLVLRISQLPLGEGRIDELRAAVAEIRERKPVIAYLTGEMGLPGMRELLLASAAGAVYAAPAGGLMVNGLSYSGFYLKDGLARLGIAFDAVATGPYKTAADPLTRSDMSSGEREALESLLDDRYARQVKAIAAARKLAEPRVRELLDQGLFTAEEAKQVGLVDAVLWPDELEEAVKRATGVRPSKSVAGASPRGAQRWGPRPRIAVVRIHGAIAPGRSRRVLGLGAIAGSATVVRYLRQAAEDSSVKAVVLRVDSPGGDMVASDAIWRGVALARRAGKPVVVSMGDVAASGGYYVSAGADAIVAEPSTLTGSIGVLVLKPDLSGLLGKLEIRSRSLQRGERARIASLVKPWTPEERRLVERQVQAAYDLFLARVAQGRRLSRDEVDRIARGRVWTGAQALERKLVDRLGSFGDALELAREKAGLAPGEAELLRLEPEPGILERLTAGAEEDADSAGEGTLGRLLAGIPEVATLGVLAEMGPVLALPTPWLAPPEGP